MDTYIGCAFVIALGGLFGLDASVKTFREPLVVQGTPTSLKYLVRSAPLVLGQVVFTLFCLSAYALILWFHLLLPQIIKLLPESGKEAVESFVEVITTKDTPILVTVISLTILFLTSVRKEFPGNPVFLFRSFVYSALAVPRACKHAGEQLINGLEVPEGTRVDLARDPLLHVGVDDFSEDREDSRRRWAELAYMNDWVEKRKDENAAILVFLEAHFGSHRLQNEFIALRELTRLPENQIDDGSRNAMNELLGELRSHYARYVACILISLSTSRLDFYRRCAEMRIDPGDPVVHNPLSYIALYIIALATAVVAGPYVTGVGYDLFDGRGWKAVDPETLAYIPQWLLLGFAYWFSPIFTVLVARYLAWKVSPVRTRISLVIYAWIFLGVFFVSLLVGTVASMSVAPKHDFTDVHNVIDFLQRGAPWSINPALTALYINYFMDLQSDPTKDDIVQTKDTFFARLGLAVAFTLGATSIAILTVAHQQLSDGIWKLAKTQVIVVGTTALIVLCLCLVAQFGLRKNLRSPDRVVGHSPEPIDALGG
jgi:hypothetical protein